MFKLEQSTKRHIENTAIFTASLLSFLIIWASFTNEPNRLTKYFSSYLEINYTLQRLFASALLVCTYSLYKRIRKAWGLTVILLTANLVLNISSSLHFSANIITVCELVILIILLLFNKDFNRQTYLYSKSKSIIISCTIITAVILNTSLGFFNLRSLYQENINFIDCFINSIYILFGSTNINIISNEVLMYERFVFIFNWICIIGCLVIILKPIIYNEKNLISNKSYVRELVLKHGQNPSSYLALENDKMYYFGTMAEGVIAYGIVNDVVIVCGDPICSENDFIIILTEFKCFCDRNNYNIVFLAVTKKYMEQYKHLGFAYVKCGEEPRFSLNDYNLVGRKIGKVRASINHARKAGLVIKEYKPLEKRESFIENSFNEISKEWLERKKSGELTFTLGSIGLDNPMDKRYFYAQDSNGVIQAFIVFAPFQNKEAYLADVIRRRNSAVSGEIELIIYEAFQILKNDGVKWCSMGLAPLANISNKEDKNLVINHLLKFIYENMNKIYGFKEIYRSKEKYNPTIWEPAYFVYSPKIMTPQMAYAVIKIQNPKGIKDYIKVLITSKHKRLK